MRQNFVKFRPARKLLTCLRIFLHFREYDSLYRSIYYLTTVTLSNKFVFFVLRVGCRLKAAQFGLFCSSCGP